MSMVTRCPACDTLYRVTPQQLQAHQGQVRCGRCLTVFDGFKVLVALPETTPASGAGPAAGTAPTGTGATGAFEAPAFELEPIEARGAGPEPAAAAVAVPQAELEDKDYGAAPEQLTLGGDAFLEQPRTRASPGTRLWAVAGLAAALALAGQAAYVFRTELATQAPGLKRYLVQVCDLLQCSVPLPQRPKLIAIEASDLQSTDPARPSVIQLTATLRNHAGYDLAYPALDLVLTNTKEHTLARRIFLPAEYLERGKDAKAGIPANAEITIRIDLDTGDLNAAGFRLDLLPAPAP
jgi:predicted Zn finger-like uncharacterized protein